jgi:oligopeptide transport system ATP-binding protein
VALLEVKDLSTDFRTADGLVHAVDGVSFHVDAGETLGLVGESGCGKSVTALSIMRLVQMPPGIAAGGEILFDGRDVLSMDDAEARSLRGRSIAMMFQDPMTSLNPVLRIGLQITEALQRHLEMDKSAAQARAIELLEQVGIPDAAARVNDYPHQFSGGMRQRVMIAMAISCHPRLILADEITTALDVTIQAQILDLLASIAEELHTAVIMITHDLGIVAGMTQRVHVMYAGRVVEKADTSELFANPRMPYTWGLLSSIPRLDQRRRAQLHPIEGVPPSLISPPPGCTFEPRCRYSRQICREREPALIEVPKTAAGHEGRCWGTQDVPDGGWLIETDWRSDEDESAAATAGDAGT